jgi:hypothetical protein
MPKIDEHDKRELELYVENTAELYPDKKKIIGLLVHRITVGRYEPNEAAKLWLGWLNKGAEMYRKEIGAQRRFPVPLREELAKDLAEKYEGAIRRHEYTEASPG